MAVLTIKLIYILAIFAVGIIGGRLPTRRGPSSTSKSEQKFALGEAFSGGIFLGAGLLLLLPDSADNFSTFAGDIDYPFSSLVVGAGFLLILLFDQASRSQTASRDTQRSGGHPFLLFLVLSIHSVIAGASLGLEGVGMASVAIFLAIVAHKGSAGFALGVALVKGGVPLARMRSTIFAFAAMTPIGVALGTFLSAAFSGTTDIVFEAIFDGLAAGTFIYITTFDILPKAMRSAGNPWLLWVVATAGFALMAVIALWT